MTDIIQNLKDVISSIKIKSLNYAELDVLLKSLQKLKDTKLVEIIETLDNKIGETNALHDSKEINYLQDKFSNVKSNTWWENSNTDVGLFLDFGNVWGVDYDSSIDESNKIRSSTGVTLNWLSPIGPLNFVISQNLSKADTDVTESFTFNLGTTF